MNLQCQFVLDLTKMMLFQESSVLAIMKTKMAIYNSIANGSGNSGSSGNGSDSVTMAMLAMEALRATATAMTMKKLVAALAWSLHCLGHFLWQFLALSLAIFGTVFQSKLPGCHLAGWHKRTMGNHDSLSGTLSPFVFGVIINFFELIDMDMMVQFCHHHADLHQNAMVHFVDQCHQLLPGTTILLLKTGSTIIQILEFFKSPLVLFKYMPSH